ncbi:MAG: hypothetical protein HYT80_00220 [Euryarchaeota archaeon]|nr:hypothetical protein [Euryarchaeota archaeon]
MEKGPANVASKAPGVPPLVYAWLGVMAVWDLVIGAVAGFLVVAAGIAALVFLELAGRGQPGIPAPGLYPGHPPAPQTRSACRE